jgi:hypothetical protein
VAKMVPPTESLLNAVGGVTAPRMGTAAVSPCGDTNTAGSNDEVGLKACASRDTTAMR